MCANRRIPMMARRAVTYRPPFHASAVSDAAIEVRDSQGMCAAITFPHEFAVLADGHAVQLAAAIVEGLNALAEHRRRTFAEIDSEREARR